MISLTKILPHWFKTALRVRHNLRRTIVSRFLLETRPISEIAEGPVWVSGAPERLYTHELALPGSAGRAGIDASFYELPPKRAYCLKDVDLLGGYNVPLHKGRMVTEMLFGTKSFLNDFGILRLLKSKLSRIQRRFESVFVINNQYCHNYYHWLFDCMPLLRMYEGVRTADPSCHLIVPAWPERVNENATPG